VGAEYFFWGSAFSPGQKEMGGPPPPPRQIEIQRRLIQVGLYGNRVTGVQHVTKLCRQFENGRSDSRSARHTMEGCERNMSGENDFLAADATLVRSQIQQ